MENVTKFESGTTVIVGEDLSLSVEGPNADAIRKVFSTKHILRLPLGYQSSQHLEVIPARYKEYKELASTVITLSVLSLYSWLMDIGISDHTVQ